MGIPYSREINKAFGELNKAYGQVTPLIEAAYEVLETTKNISLLVAAVQVINGILLFFVLLTMFGLLITMNPDMTKERDELVTPVLRWVGRWAFVAKTAVVSFAVLFISALILYLAVRWGVGPFAERQKLVAGIDDEEEEGQADGEGEKAEGDEAEEKSE